MKKRQLYEEREKIADKIRAIDTTNPANQDGVQSLIDQMLAVNLRITTVEGQLRELEANETLRGARENRRQNPGD